jgi:hypothetical protein
MGLFSYETIEKILFPENKKQKVVGCVLLLFITNGIVFAILKEATWAHFFKYYLRISIMAICGLNILYVVYDLICESRLKRLKEIYMSYYWLVTAIPPSIPVYGVIPPYKGVPEYIIDALKKQSRLYKASSKESLINCVRLGTLITLREDENPQSPFYAKYFDDLINKVLHEDIPRLHTRDGLEITREKDKIRLWDEKVPSGETEFWDFASYVVRYKEEARQYLSTEHIKNLKKLGD